MSPRDVIPFLAGYIIDLATDHKTESYRRIAFYVAADRYFIIRPRKVNLFDLYGNSGIIDNRRMSPFIPATGNGQGDNYQEIEK